MTVGKTAHELTVSYIQSWIIEKKKKVEMTKN